MKLKIQKTLYIILLGTIFNQILSAQESTAHMSIFNAVESEKNLAIDWGTINAFPNGIPYMQSFGPVIVPAGGVTITAKVEGFLDGKSSVSIPASNSCSYIVWPSELVEKDGEKTWKLKITSVPPLPLDAGNKTSWTLIYNGLLESISVEFNNRPYILTPEKAVSAGGANDATLSIGDKILESQSVEGGNYIFIIYGNSLDTLKAGTIHR